MDQLSLVNQAIAYIEDRLLQPITTAEIAAAMGYSRAHFGRLFLDLTGETLAGYIRKRRLTEAARKLIVTRCPILEVALDHQFESQEAFTRSFKRRFRLSPGAYRRRGHFTGAFQRITLRCQHVHRLYSERGKVPLLDDSLAGGQVSSEWQRRIVPVHLYSLLVKHPNPSSRTNPKNTVYLWYR